MIELGFAIPDFSITNNNFYFIYLTHSNSLTITNQNLMKLKLPFVLLFFYTLSSAQTYPFGKLEFLLNQSLHYSIIYVL